MSAPQPTADELAAALALVDSLDGLCAGLAADQQGRRAVFAVARAAVALADADRARDGEYANNGPGWLPRTNRADDALVAAEAALSATIADLCALAAPEAQP